MRKIMNKKVLGIIALALVCVLAGTVIGTTIPAATADEQTVVLTSPFTEAIAKVRNSVVGVNNYQIVNSYNNGYDSYDMFPWSYFGFGNGYGNGYGGYGNGNGRKDSDSSREVKYGSGSGVVVEKEYVLTNYHVVEDSHSLKISIDGDEDNLYDATVAAYDEDKDVAVLYVPGLPLEPVELGDSDALQGYGYQMWRCRPGCFRADGARGQYIIVVPDKNAVIAITSDVEDLQGELNLVWNYILPAL